MTSEKRLVEELLGTISLMQGQPSSVNSAVKESLDNVRAMLAREDRGWDLFRGGNGKPEEGLTIDDLKEWSAKLRESTIGAPWIKRGFTLRSSYVWQGGMRYAGIRQETRGLSPKVQQKIDDPLNQRNFFSKDARRKREGVLYHDGIALWIGDDVTKKLYPIPLTQITGILSDPDFPGIIMAYRRAWSQRQKNGEWKDMVRWYFVDAFKDQETATIGWAKNGGSPESEKVDKTMTAFDMHPNSMEGWPLGAPDALAAWIWNQIAKELYMDGVDVSSAMATLAFKVTSASKAGSQNAAVQFASPQGAGGTAVMGAGTDLSIVASAGKGYQFSTVREVISMIATSISVSNIDLTSNPGDAGSSYGSANALTPAIRLAMLERRDEHIALDKRILTWMGEPTAEPYFEPLEDGAEQYRRAQTIVLGWQQGLYSAEEAKARMEKLHGNPLPGAVPDGIIIPSNINFPESTTNDATTGTQAGSPTQGQSSGAGGSSSDARDARDDTIS